MAHSVQKKRPTVLGSRRRDKSSKLKAPGKRPKVKDRRIKI
jgi:hypothetical protein